MIQELEKKPKVALCRKCYGTGHIHDKDTGEEHECPQCEGTGRVTVSARMVYDIRPYKPRTKQ
jgi:DnaJ-class molecular chaperone